MPLIDVCPLAELPPGARRRFEYEDLDLGRPARADIKNTYDKLGIPEAEKKYLAGVGAQYESEVVYHKIREDLEKQGVIFLDMDTALREHPELVKEYFGTIIPPNDNKFAALNSAVWSGGSFIYVPPGVKVEMPLQAYFRINAENMGQFERTLIIVDEGAYVHYVEGCTAPIYSPTRCTPRSSRSSSRRAAAPLHDDPELVEQRLQPRHQARRRLRGRTMEWIDGNIGSKLTMKYPAST
jgi:Fe-S cluster assembly protein SufB